MGVRSKVNVGDGSTFFFTLPTVTSSSDELKNLKVVEGGELTQFMDSNDSIQVDEQAFTILVVDNEPNTLDLHTRIVHAHSLSNRILTAHSGQSALETLERETDRKSVV